MLGYSIKKDSALRKMQRRAEMAEQRAARLESDLLVCEIKRDELSGQSARRGESIRVYRDTLRTVYDELQRPIFNTKRLRALIEEVLKNENV